jgi:hypothetical protein
MRFLPFLLVLITLSTPFFAQTQKSTPTPAAPPSPTPSPAQQVPVMDGGMGPCSLELTVTDKGKPVYASTVKVHIAYGFAGIKKMDLEAGTNSDGKVKFTGLPAKVHNPPLEFHASKDQLVGTAAYNPASECQAKHDIILEKLPEPSAQVSN